MFATGLQSPCRFCGVMVTFGSMIPADRAEWEDPHIYAREAWWEASTATYLCPSETNELRRHQPRLYCIYEKGDGTVCHKKIKPEDIKAGTFACGVHMRFCLEEIRRVEAMVEEAERQAEKQEIMKWEGDLYSDAYEELKILLGIVPELKYATQVVERNYRGDRIDRIRKEVEFDIIELRDALVEAIRLSRIVDHES